MSIQTLFPKWYYQGKVNNHQYLKKLLMKEMNKSNLVQPEDWNCTLKTSFSSDSNYDDFSWGVFYDSIKPNLIEMHKELGGKDNTNISMVEAWINVYSKGDSQEVHTHVGGQESSTFSCSYFLQYDKEDAKFIFFDPDQSKHLGNYSKYYPTFNTWLPEITEGDIIVFPSHQHHQVGIHRSNNTRITVSANFTI
tara:strand:+ start:87 stop:668 length:582 start_codon:yes stop_codon:yes gene_type:complete